MREHPARPHKPDHTSFEQSRNINTVPTDIGIPPNRGIPLKTEGAKTKRCPECNQVKTADAFGYRGKYLKSYCHECRKKISRRHHAQKGTLAMERFIYAIHNHETNRFQAHACHGKPQEDFERLWTKIQAAEYKGKVIPEVWRDDPAELTLVVLEEVSGDVDLRARLNHYTSNFATTMDLVRKLVKEKAQSNSPIVATSADDPASQEQVIADIDIESEDVELSEYDILPQPVEWHIPTEEELKRHEQHMKEWEEEQKLNRLHHKQELFGSGYTLADLDKDDAKRKARQNTRL